MKLINLALIALFLFTNSSFAQKDPKNIISNGFGLKFHYSGYKSYDLNGYGFELTNQWYFGRNNNKPFAFAILLTWMDGSIAYKSEDSLDFTNSSLLLNSSVFEIGPLVTYMVQDNMAIDMHYQVRPTFYYHSFDLTNQNGFYDQEYFAESYTYGASHNIGFSFRYDILHVGLELGFGELNGKIRYDNPDPDADPLLADTKMDTRNTRLILGLKF